MTQYSAEQIAQFAYNAGFRGTALVQATAVALAESGGTSNAVSSDGYGSHGLWQFIPSTWASVTGTPFVNADDPQKNADAAFKLYNSNGKSFAGQWSTWPGAAAPHMAAATVAAAKITSVKRPLGSDTWLDPAQGTSLADSNAASANPLNLVTGWVGDFVKAILTPALNLLIDAGMVAGGGALLFLGVYMLTRSMAGG